MNLDKLIILALSLVTLLLSYLVITLNGPIKCDEVAKVGDGAICEVFIREGASQNVLEAGKFNQDDRI